MGVGVGEEAGEHLHVPGVEPAGGGVQAGPLGYPRWPRGEAGARRLAEEGRRYAGNRPYADHFERMDVDPVETGIRGETATDIQRGLERWKGVLDEIVVRSITPNDTLEETLALVRAGAPRA